MPRSYKQTGIAVLILLLSFGGLYYLLQREQPELPIEDILPEAAEPEVSYPLRAVIGASLEGRSIEAYTYGDGDTHLLFVGGMHGGYEWNSVLLAYQFMDYLKANPEALPDELRVTVVPSVNPDGMYKIIGKEGRFTLADAPTETERVATAPGRFNANGVDLNRNFDCKWKSTGVWRGNSVGTGAAPFSEPEARAIRDLVLRTTPDAVIFWHSQANAVYASECEDGILPETLEIMNIYAQAADYRAVPAFDAYEINGDAEGWLASIGIPALTVELETHQTVEWERNLAGIKAVLSHYERESGIAR